MSSKPEISDAAQRLQALDTSRSFAVAAPAGSGKTGLLTQRVLKLLAEVKKPEQILCLTFTRKAAAEMSLRIQTALAAADGPEPEDSYQKLTWQLARNALIQDKTQGWELRQSPNRLRVTTIDSFCRSLARQLTPESGMSDSLQTLDNAEHLYTQAASHFLMNNLERSTETGSAIRTLLAHQDNNLNRLTRLLVTLLSKREQWLSQLMQSRGARSQLEAYLEDIIASTTEKLHNALLPVAGDLLMLADYAATNLLARGNPEDPLLAAAGIEQLPGFDPDSLAQWLALCHLLMTKTNTLRKPTGVNNTLGFPTAKDDPEFGAQRKQQIKELLQWCEGQPALLEALEDVRYLPSASYPENQWQVLEALAIILPVLAAELKTLFQQQNQCDFTEVTLSALQALGSDEQPTELALRLDYQIQHILVDEFQDTSTIQYQLLQALTRGWQTWGLKTSGDHAVNHKSMDGRTLFIVGDGMQSLYSFRNANVGLFLEARTHPLGDISLTPLDLTTNFRSQQGIVEWVNQAFVKSFPSQDNINRGAVRYYPAQAFKTSLNETAVTIDGFLDFANLEAEANKVLEHIHAARESDPNGSIAILVRDRGYLKHLLPKLRDAGLRWTARDIEPLASQMQILDLLSLTRAILNPADRIAWLSVLRAPWCGLTLKDLYHLTNQPLPKQNPLPKGARLPLILLQLANLDQIPGLSDQGRLRLSQIAPLLIQSWQQRQRKSLRSTIEGLWLSLGGQQLPAFTKNPGSCYAYFNLLEQHEVSGTLENWQTFQQAVEKLYADPESDSDPNLQIMTIHKAKGLEFDTVIISGLNRKSASSDNPLLLWRESISEHGQPQLVISPIESTGGENDATYRHLIHEQKLKEQLENTRVMYVGATRAIKRLHLLYSKKTNANPTAGSLLQSIWPWLQLQLENSDGDGDGEQVLINQHKNPDESQFTTVSNNLPTFNSLMRFTTLPEPCLSLGETNIFTETDNLFSESTPSEVDTEATLTGTLLHRILRRITLDGIHNWTLQTLQQRKPFWALQLNQSSSQSIEENVQRLETAIATLLKDTQHHWLFDHQLAESQCEYPVGYIDENGYSRTAVLDRTFIHQGKNNTLCRWIIDYKLSQPQPGQDVQNFLKNQKRLYQSQLSLYARLLSSRESLPVKTALYFPLLGQLLELDPEDIEVH